MGKKMNWESEADFCIKIDFEKNSPGNPARIFEAMSGLIRCFQSLDENLAECVDKKVRTELILTDIEAGSLLTWLRTFISDIDDSELMEHGWKAITRTFLLKTKHLMLKFLHDKKLDKSSMKQLQDNIERMAEETNVKKIPTYGNVRRKDLLDFYERASTSVSVLTEKDDAKYISPEEETAISKAYEISEEVREEILTKESSTSQHDLILPVKKPDYLGQSKWELRYQGHTIEAAIEDKQWLSTFQQGLIRLSPGDSLSARVEFKIKEDFDTGESDVHHHVLKVKEVIHAHKQQDLFPDNDAPNIKDEESIDKE